MIKEVYFTEVKWKPTHDDLGGVSGKIVFKKPVSYQDYLSISRKEYLLLDENKDKEIERLNNIIKKLEEFIEREIKLYTIELTEENKNILGYTAPIRGVYKEIYNVLQELKGSDKE